MDVAVSAPGFCNDIYEQPSMKRSVRPRLHFPRNIHSASRASSAPLCTSTLPPSLATVGRPLVPFHLWPYRGLCHYSMFSLTRLLCEILYRSLNKAVAFFHSLRVVVYSYWVLVTGVYASAPLGTFPAPGCCGLRPLFWYAFGALSVLRHRPVSVRLCRPHQCFVYR